MSLIRVFSCRYRLLLALLLLQGGHACAGSDRVDGEQQLALGSSAALEAAEMAGDFHERIRLMQEWLNARRLERGQGPSPNGTQGFSRYGQNSADNEDEDEEALASTDYFTRRGLDERGYRRLDGNIRVRIRGLQGERAHLIQTPESAPAAGVTERIPADSGTPRWENARTYRSRWYQRYRALGYRHSASARYTTASARNRKAAETALSPQKFAKSSPSPAAHATALPIRGSSAVAHKSAPKLHR